MDKQNDLSLLMFSLSQLENKTQIIKLFHESLNELFKPLKFFFSENNPNNAPYCLEITANDITYGYLFSDEIPDNEIIVSIQNALQVLTVILEKLKTEEELKGRARSFESIAQKRLDAIKASVAELEDSRKESLNLIKDLKSEIAEREKIEKALRESEEKYHALFFNNRTVMLLIDSENGKILEANPAASSFYGWTLDEMKNMSLFDINTSAKKEILQNISKAKQKEQNYFHFIHRLKDGTQKEVDIYSWPITIKDKGYLFSIIHDTTQQIIAEKKLEENERLFRSIVENSFEGIGLIDNNFTFTYVNENLAKLLNYPVEEIVGSNFIQFFAPENREIVTDRHIRRKRGEQVPSRYEVLLLKKDGEKVVTEISASTFKDSDGNPLILVQFIDITEKKKAEEKLRLQRYHQQIILDASPTAIWFKDKKNNIIRANKAAAIIAKKSVEEMEGKPSKEFFPEDAEKYYLDDLEVINSGNPKIGIVEPITSGDTTSWLRTDKLPWYDEEGNIAGVVVYSEDITEIKDAEETVRKERDQAQRYLDIAGVMFGSLNINGEITLINKKGLEILGYKDAEELIGKNWLDTCLPKANKDEVNNVIREQMAGNVKPFEYHENPVITKSGEERIIAFNNTILADSDGKITGVLFSGEDITEREKAKRSLLETQYHLSTIYNTVGDIIYYIKVEGKNKYRFVSVNEMFYRATGLTEEQVVGKYVNEVIPEQSLNIVLSNYERAIKEKNIVRWEEVTPYPTGLKTGEVSIAPVYDSNGKCTYLVGSVHDITEQKKAEEEIKNLAKFPSENPNSVLRVDLDGKIIFANHGSTPILKEWKSKIGESVPKHVMEKISSTFEKNETSEIEITCGEAVIDCILTPVIEGKYVNIYGRDITDSKRAGETIKRERDQAQRYLDIAGVMFVSLNFKGEIVIVNKKGCEILGYDNADELVGKNWLDTCLPDSNKQEIKDVFREQMAGNIKAFEYYENPVITKSGEERLIAFHNTILLDQKGNISGVLFSGEDITERVKAEEQIKKLNAELEIRVIERTADLEKANKNLEEINDIFVGREMRIIELKEEVDKLKKKLLEK